MVPSDMHFDNTKPFVDHVGAIVNDVIVTNEVNVNEQPNAEAQTFYDILQAAQRPSWDGCTNQTELPNVIRLMSIKSYYSMSHMLQTAWRLLWDGCTNQTELSHVVRLMSIKFDYNMPQNCLNEAMQLMHESCPVDRCEPKNYSELKKKVRSLGLDVQTIDCCRSGCMLYFKEDSVLEKCKFYDLPRWKPKKLGDNRNKPKSYVKMFYFPLTPRLQCLYTSRNIAKHMR